MPDKNQLFDREAFKNSAFRLMTNLEIKEAQGVTLKYITDKVKFVRGWPVRLIAAPLKDVYSGLCLHGTDDIYYLCYDNDLTGRPRLLVILHEIGHILRGDLEANGALPLDLNVVLAAACGYTNDDLRKMPGLVCLRDDDDPEETEPTVEVANDAVTEMEIDYNASQLLQHLVLDDEQEFINSMQYLFG
jgi:hypothetical protein